MKLKISKINFSEIAVILNSYLIMLLILITTATPLLAMYYSTMVVTIFIFTVVSFLFLKRYVSKRKMLLGIFILLLFFCTFLISGDNDFSHYLGMALLVFSSLFVSEVMDFEEYKFYFLKFVVFMAFYSLIITIYSNLNLSFPGELPVLESEVGIWRSFYNIYYYWGWSPYSRYIRNSAFFREPGVWGAVLSLALFFKVQNTNEKSNKKDLFEFAILIISGLLSLSTTAIIGIGLCVLYYITKNRVVTISKLLLAFAILVLGITFVASNSTILFSKFSQSSNFFVSLSDRLYGMFYGLESWLENPIFGIGQEKYLSNLKEGNSANSFIDILGKYGIIVFVMVVFNLFRWVSHISKDKWTIIILSLILIINLSVQNILMYPLFLVLVFYGVDFKKA